MSRPPTTPPPETPSTPPGGRPDEERWQQLAAAWRRRIEAPPSISPETAAARVVARLAERERTRRPWFASPSLWGPVLTAACALVLVLSLRFTIPPAMPEQTGEVLAASAPSTDELVLWLDDETPLYFTLEPSAGVADMADVADDARSFSEGDL